VCEHTLHVHGHTIGLERLYATMYDQSHVVGGVRVYNGNRADTTALKWLLAQLFGLPTTPEYNKIYGDARRAVTDEFDRLGWATKVDRDSSPVAEGTHQTRTARYLLHRELDHPA
jgi:hypothetical protein